MKITVLHLSDLHIHGDASDWFLTIPALIASTAFLEARESALTLVVVTGDITYSSTQEQFARAFTFLEAIRAAFQAEGCEHVEIITVPGNHDCALKPEDRTRSVVIDAITKDTSKARDSSLVETCVKAQSNYFSFRDKLPTNSVVDTQPLWQEHEFTLGGNIVRISSINAAWMSRIPETPGSLVFPVDLFHGLLQSTSDLRLALVHHPLNWYAADTYHPLRKALRSSATAVLSGHEHNPGSGQTIDTEHGSSLYFEAASLNPHKADEHRGHSVLCFDLATHVATEGRYSWAEGNKVKQTDSHSIPFRADLRHMTEELTTDFQAALEDPGGKFMHPLKGAVTLNDIFVFPELKRLSGDHHPLETISSRDLVFGDLPGRLIRISGEEKAGKTTFLLKAFASLHSQGLLCQSFSMPPTSPTVILPRSSAGYVRLWKSSIAIQTISTLRQRISASPYWTT